MKDLELTLRRLKDGEVNFGRFVRETVAIYESMARYLLRRWRTPCWMQEEDVVQELYVETWRHLPKYDPTRGTSLAGFVVFGAMSETKRRMHKARGVSIHGSPDRKASRIEPPVSSLARRGDEDGATEAYVASLLAEEPVAEEGAIEAERVRSSATTLLRACRTPEERTAALAVREAGSLDGACRVLYDDAEHRLDWRLGSEELADRFVRRNLVAVASRMRREVGSVTRPRRAGAAVG